MKKLFDRLFFDRLVVIAIAIFLPLAITFTHIPAAQAFDAPELLPEKYTNVIDLGKFLNDAEELALDQKLTKFEEKLAGNCAFSLKSIAHLGRAVKDFWGLDDVSVMLVADGRGRNLLNFSVGDTVYPLLPRGFWIELQSRYGNQFYVREQGYDQSILSSIDAIATCLDQDGCAVVPGIPQEQWILTLITSIVGGIIFGFAGHPRKEGEIFAWKWALIFTPIWGMLFISFGLGPVVTRTNEWIPIVRNVAGFVGGAVIAYLIPSPKRITPASDV